ncbi:hypothetical protein [Streptomyces sp. NPDC047803]|uniref:hypothetical protein n=1 Tax=Streptomyces TaxID=1883 RepID=UPI0033C75E2F
MTESELPCHHGDHERIDHESVCSMASSSSSASGAAPTIEGTITGILRIANG